MANAQRIGRTLDCHYFGDGRMRILVVDDEHELAAIAAHLLRRHGHVPIVALDPHDALERLGPDIDAVISDIEMPDLNGVELVHRIRERDPELPIVFCTGSAPGDDTARRAAQLAPVHPKLTSSDDVDGVMRDLRRGADCESTAARAARRYRSRVPVSYRSGAALAQRFTDNVSRTGLFVRGAESLSLGQPIDVEIELPPHHHFSVRAEVAFVLPAEDHYGRHPGAGLRVTHAPDDYHAALDDYLTRLDRRGDYVVFAAAERSRAALAEAGYLTMETPPPDLLAAALDQCDVPVIAVMVPLAAVDEYSLRAARVGRPTLVRGVASTDQLDAHIAELDRAL